MIRFRTFLLFFPLFFQLASSNVTAGSHSRAVHFEPRDRGDARPNIEFSAAPDAAPVLVKSQYNQFAAAPGRDTDADGPAAQKPHQGSVRRHEHDGKKEPGGNVNRKALLKWMHRVGLHPNRHQVEKLSDWIDTKRGRGQHHHKHQKGQHQDGQGYGKLRHKHQHATGNDHHGGKDHSAEKGAGKPPSWVEVDRANQNSKPPVRNVGVLPPGIGKPRGWSDEASGPPSLTPPSTSPAAAAVAPHPEPVNSVPARTASSSSSSSSPSTPLPGSGLAPPQSDSSAPVTTLPSPLPPPSSQADGTSGSLNPSSTTPPHPAPAAAGGDKRLAPLAANSTGTVGGIPVVDDDGDAKKPKPKVGTTSGASGAAVVGAWTASVLVAGATTVVVVVLFAV